MNHVNRYRTPPTHRGLSTKTKEKKKKEKEEGRKENIIFGRIVDLVIAIDTSPQGSTGW